MRRADRLIAVSLLGLSLLCPVLCRAEEPAAATPLLAALEAELARSKEQLALPDFERPYFVSYLLKEDRVFSAVGRFGALVSQGDEVQRNLYVEVRVGDYDFDNSSSGGVDFNLDPAANMPELFRYVQAPIDDDPVALRNQLWLLTDAKYKQALSAFQAKKGRAVFMVEEEDRPPDFSREEPHVFLDQPLHYEVDREAWKDLVRKETAFLRDVEHLTDSAVQVVFDEERKYLVNSEGSRVYTNELYFSLVATAETRAPDGMPLQDAYTFYCRTPRAVPDEEMIHRGLVEMVRRLHDLRRAEVIDPYNGPAILAPSVAGVFFHEAVGHRLEGERQKNPEEGQTFAGKVGQTIMPTFITILDDPTVARHGGTYLNGHYKFDDEGIPARRVVLVEKGVLRNFLLSRSPIKGFLRSNGHGRNASYEDPTARMANLFVKSDREVSLARLKEMLIEEVRKQGKPYGLILHQSVGGETATGSYDFQAFRNRPTLIYKVDAQTGEETLVRGAEVVGTPLVSITKLIATGDDYQVFNGYCGAESGYIPVAAVAPSCLVAEIELQRVGDQPQRPPILPPPTPRTLPLTPISFRIAH